MLPDVKKTEAAKYDILSLLLSVKCLRGMKKLNSTGNLKSFPVLQQQIILEMQQQGRGGGGH